jgi:hypothetical protein
LSDKAAEAAVVGTEVVVEAVVEGEAVDRTCLDKKVVRGSQVVP